MENFFLIHGVGGYPKENWFFWLTTELQNKGYEVIVPQFPTPKNQTLENWLEVIKKYEDEITEQTTFIGHSLGVPFTLNVLEKHKIKRAILVAGFYGIAGNKFDDSMKTFAQKQFDWPAIKQNCKEFIIFHSDNDPYIKIEKAYELAEKLDIHPIIIPNAGHFNVKSGYTKFEELLKLLINKSSQVQE